ncbi:Hypothetical predicted protein [Pelobates cultripes]|uniref:Uncharacterized protein n=1 Tax=Pelobates cultripes TaxID=61616 RepID=A0AAD1QZX3_PELCU|nr:Hypothetical predicted protein [Pelobates cultripes]
MAKSRSRSPRWKHRPPLHRSPEQHRQRHYSDEGFRRDARRPIHWEEDRHGQNNPRIVPHNRFNDKLYEQNLFPPKIRKSPLEPADRLRRIYSPERHGESSRRFPTKYPEDAPHRDNDRNLNHHRNQGRNLHDDANGFRIGRREDSFHGPHRREPDWERGENGDHWKQEGHRDQHALPYRRNSQERGIFPKRYPEDRNFKEPGQGPKRLRETERLEHRPLPRNPHWKPDHVFRPSEGKDWSKTSDFRNPSPLVHRANSGEFTKIEYDYSHKSPSYVGMDLPFPDDFVDKHNRNEERKPVHTKNSHDGNILDSHTRERGKYSSERLLDSSTKYSSKKYHNSDRDNLKNEMESKHQNYKYKERGRNNSVPHKESIPPTDQLDQSSNSSVSKPALNNTSSMETITEQEIIPK